MKKFIKILIVILGLMLLAIWSPWHDWNLEWTRIFGIESKAQFSGLKLKSFLGELELFIDDKSMGIAEDDGGFLEVFPVEPGEHVVKIVRPNNEGFYIDFEKTLNFEKDVDVIIGYDLGPSPLFSEGHVLTAKRTFTKGQNPVLDIVSEIKDIDVKIDGVQVGKTPLHTIPMDISSTHILSFSKNGYDPLEIEIFPTEQTERDKLKDLNLILEINLFAKPIELTAQYERD